MRFSIAVRRIWLVSVLVWNSAQAADFAVFPPATTNVVGDTFSLKLLEDGATPSPDYQFQWFQGSTPLADTATISGSQSSVLSFSNCRLEDSGEYRVQASGAGVAQAWATSRVYVVDVPAVQNVFLTPLGAGVTFTVEATGGLLAYQWMWQGREIPGATSSVLRFTDAYAQASAGYYSVIVTNFLGVVTSPSTLFTKAAPSGVYQGVFAMDSGVAPETAGAFQITVSSSKRTYSGAFAAGPYVWRRSGRFDLDHSFVVTLPRPDASALELHLQFVTTNDAPQVIGILSDGEAQGTIQGYRVYYSTKNPTSLTGRYTLALMNTNAPVPLETPGAAPSGDGCASVIVHRNGVVTMAGRVADGTPFSQSRSLSRLGDLAVRVQMLNRREQLLGWLKVAKVATGNIRGGPVTWMKVGDAGDRSYTNGFYLDLVPAGSTYNRTNSPILSWTNGVASLYGGDLVAGTNFWEVARVYLKPPQKLIPEPGPDRLSLTINKTNGTIHGHFTDLATGLRTPLLAVLLQQQKSARGFFSSTNSNGGFVLVPATQ